MKKILFLVKVFYTKNQIRKLGLGENMKKKIIGICVIMLLLSIIIPVSGETVEQEKREGKESSFKFIRRGYIETIITGDFIPTGEDSVFGFGMFCHYGENSKTMVYSEEGGDILWYVEGKHRMIYGFFTGIGVKTEDNYMMCGNSFFIIGIASLKIE